MVKQEKSTELQIMSIQTARMSVCILGITPLVFNSFSFKATTQLLLPRGKMTNADKATNIKHNPPQEFRDSVYTDKNENGPTRLVFPSNAFKKAMMTAALRMPGAAKTEIGQLVWPDADDIKIYGIPELLMLPVRSAGMNRTPDIRTRAIVSRWACSISLTYVRPQLGDLQIGNLLGAAGLICGIGDGRQEKGALNYGQFELVSENDARHRSILKNGGREAQDAALATPTPYDLESEKLLDWYMGEIKKMGDKIEKKKSKKDSEAPLSAS